MIRFGAEYGVQPVTRLPEYLDSYNYATLMKLVLMTACFLCIPTLIFKAGRNSTGVNDLLHPNVDYYKEFCAARAAFRKATLELSGGNARAKYAVTVGYTGSSGLEK